MSGKALYYIAAFVGSLSGGYIPTLWGAEFLSVTSLVFSTLGAILAIVLVYKLSN
jgi:uncharacterized membrane protein YeaQ/YmgE (transglycosylase-associated protein family)